MIVCSKALLPAALFLHNSRKVAALQHNLKNIAMKKSTLSISTKSTSVFSAFHYLTIVRLLVMSLCIFYGLVSFSQNPSKTFTAGAYIIDMGQNSAINKGLKPYGLVYALIHDYNVPVYWSINSSKIKDGVDFTLPAGAGSKSYKGGPFIISSDQASIQTVINLISTWKAKGAVVDGPITTAFDAPVFNKLTTWPRAIVDDDNDTQIITPYYANAGVPSTSYLTQGNPTQLTSCGDIYVLPHADPQEWPICYVTALKNYINNGGYLWVGCHAVSALDLGWSGPPVTAGFDFLTTNGLVPWEDHNKPSNSATYTYNPSCSADPVMQFMGTMDASLHNGSEEIYLAKSGSLWRTSTKVAVYCNNYTDSKTHITYAYPANPAVLVAYGPAYGDLTKGMVMYEAGHDYKGEGTIQSEIAAERAFFNFVLLAGIQQQITITNVTFPTALTPNTSYTLSATVSGTIGSVTYLWSAEGGGTFSSTSTNPTTYTAPPSIGNIILRLKVTDGCGRSNFASAFMNGGSAVSCVSQAVLPATPAFKDNCGNNITFTYVGAVDNPSPLTCEGTRTYSWSYTDYTTCNPSASPYTRQWSYVYSIKDEIAPIWRTAPGALNRTVKYTAAAALSAAQELAPVAIDNCQGSITYAKTSGSFVAGSCGTNGTYTNTWVAKDPCLNASSVYIQVITVTAPTWSGPVSTDWDNPANWVGNNVPLPSDNVFIPGDCSHYPVLVPGKIIYCNNLEICGSFDIASGGALTVTGDLTIIGSLVVESGGSLITSCNVTGIATIERQISNNLAWHLLSSPVSGQTICNSVFAPTFSNFPGNIYTWDFYKWSPNCPTPPYPAEHWRNLRTLSQGINFTDFGTTPEFVVTKGYLVAYGSGWPVTHAFIGNPNACDKVCSFFDIITECSWELAGNPFPSAVDWNQVTGKSNLVTDYYYVWNENKSGGPGYEYWKDVSHQSSSMIDGNIPSMQGFFVKVGPNGGKTLGLPNSSRVHDVLANHWLKESPANRLSIMLGNGTNYDEAIVMFENNGSVGKDQNDAEKLFSMATEVPQVYSIIDNDQKTALNSLPYITDGTTIPVGIVAPVQGNYSITVNGIESFSPLTGLSLEDLKLNFTQNLRQNPVYNFTAAGNEDAGRFLLHFAGPIGFGEKDNSAINIYSSEKTVFITCAAGFRNAQVTISNLLGQEILTRKLNYQTSNQVTVNALKGYYVVKVQNESSVKTVKVYIN